VTPDVRDYLVRFVRATRESAEVELGASPRATLALYRVSQAWALLEGRTFVIPDDIKRLAPEVLSHRLVLSPAARLRGGTPRAVVDQLAKTLEVPVEKE